MCSFSLPFLLPKKDAYSQLTNILNTLSLNSACYSGFHHKIPINSIPSPLIAFTYQSLLHLPISPSLQGSMIATSQTNQVAGTPQWPFRPLVPGNDWTSLVFVLIQSTTWPEIDKKQLYQKSWNFLAFSHPDTSPPSVCIYLMFALLLHLWFPADVYHLNLTTDLHSLANF